MYYAAVSQIMKPWKDKMGYVFLRAKYTTGRHIVCSGTPPAASAKQQPVHLAVAFTTYNGVEQLLCLSYRHYTYIYGPNAVVMEAKYNQISVEQYSRQLAKALADRHFRENESVNGPQLIHFTPLKQVNLFVIKELLQQWNNEMAHLQSPYFDFENAEVKEALVQFMNILSRKILIRRPHFEPLLAKAIADTFAWTLDPVLAFDQKFLPAAPEISAAGLSAYLKYISTDKELLREFISTLPAGELPRDTVLQQFRAFTQRRAADRTSVETLLADFNAVLPLKREDVVLTNAAPAPPSPDRTAEELILAPERFTPQPPPAVPVTAEPAASLSQAGRSNGTAEGNLNERFKAERTTSTLNAQFAKPEQANIAQNEMSKKIESLKNSISINQRFSFINELFNGENLEYYQVIQTLDQFTDAASAKNYVTSNLANRYDWSRKEEHVTKLLRLIDRKFAEA